MTTNPFYNALFAIAYIVLLVSAVFFGTELMGGPEDSIFYPMAALGTLTFSAALMAFLFFYQPVLLLLDGQREKGVKLFLKTMAVFAGAVIILLFIGLVVTS